MLIVRKREVMKTENVKCHKCKGRDHFASKCPENRNDHVASSTAVSRNAFGRSCKDVKIGDNSVTALVDTGSDLCLMRADKYIQIGVPALQGKEVCFRGVGSSGNKTLDEFCTEVTIDGNHYQMKIHIVSGTLMQHELLIGTDFLNTVEIIMKEANILINKPKRDDARPNAYTT